MADAPTTRATSAASLFGWAAFLACSWTWCIGMFLPVLLIRDFGPWSFAAFAVPNVLGAAAMGYALRAPGASERFVQRHRGTCEAFSLVTRAFQYFFLVWLLLGLTTRWVGLTVLGAFLVGMLLGTSPYRGDARVRLGAILMFLLSTACLAIAGLLGGLHWPSPDAAHPAFNTAHLGWLAPVCAFGFVLCPYLDLSFHHVRQSLPEPVGSRTFAIGFGVLFLAMITATFFYAWMFFREFGESRAIDWPALTPAGVLVLAHIGAQLGYTIELHRAESVAGGHVAQSRGFGWGGLGIAAGVIAKFMPTVAGLEAGEALYRGFLAFYGLVFPAYVWLCVIPTRDGHSGPSRRKLLVWCGAIGLAAPMFWMGFIMRQTAWLAPGLGIVLLSRLLILRSPEVQRGD